MKRHPTLHPLSHDHQNALARALRLRRAADRDTDARREAVLAFLEFADSRIMPHFVEEETILDRAVDVSDLESMRAARARLLDEHERLRGEFEQLRVALDTDELEGDLLEEVGRALHDHIRYEERTLFQQIQHDLTDEQLGAIVAGG